MLTGLNDKQKEAVTTTEGPVMVMAGAGSGKTKVLTNRIAYILNETGISPYSILAVTFTNKAANEMKKRISNIIDLDTKYMWISTFHSFCARFLRMEIDKASLPYNCKFTILDEEDSLKIVKQILKDLEIDNPKPKDFQSLISKSKNFTELVIKDPVLRENFLSVSYKYNEYLKDNNMLDFDDLILVTIEVLKENTEILMRYQEKFQYILVDEFQDTNDSQYKLMFMLAARHHNIFVVGDDFQSIYSFRGAKIENIERFRKDFLEHKLILLERNYRSTSEILELANDVITKNENQIKKVLYTENKNGQIPFLYQATTEKTEARFVIEKIKQFHNQGDNYSDCAIMYRNNSISRNFEDVLIQNHIPYKIYGALSFFARKEIKDMIAYIRVLINPNDDFSFSRIVNEPKRKIGDVLLEKLALYSTEINTSLFDAILSFNSNTQGGKALKSFYVMMNSFKEQLENIPLNKLVDLLLDETGYKNMLLVEDPESERLDNIYELKTVLKELEEKPGSNEDRLTEFLNDLALRTDNENETDEDCVILTTYHQAKGLEFKNVFMVATEEGIFPSRFHQDDFDMEEERRICYVGITRAKERLYITHTQTRMLYGKPNESQLSRFISELDKTHYKSINSKADDLNSEKKIKIKKVKKDKGEEKYKLGDKIMHKVYGKGVVVGYEKDSSIKVAFAHPTGIKVLFRDHPSYQKIDK